jgi:hypothetical protein
MLAAGTLSLLLGVGLSSGEAAGEEATRFQAFIGVLVIEGFFPFGEAEEIGWGGVGGMEREKGEGVVVLLDRVGIVGGEEGMDGQWLRSSAEEAEGIELDV